MTNTVLYFYAYDEDLAVVKNDLPLRLQHFVLLRHFLDAGAFSL